MSWNHGTYGFDRYEKFVQALDTIGIKYEETLKDEVFIRGADFGCCCVEEICEHKQHLRIAKFKNTEGLIMFAEEWLSVDDHDCDGASQIDLAVYEEGNRPELVTEILPA